MKKILLCLLALGFLVGCSSQEKEKDTPTEEQSTNSDISNHVSLPSLFEVDQTKKYELGLDNYFIYEPVNMGFHYTRGTFTYLNLVDKIGDEIGVRILYSKLYESDKQKISNIDKISSKDFEIAMARDSKLLKIERGFNKLNYQENKTSTNLNGKEAILNKGVATEVSNSKKSLTYAMFDFFLDEDKIYPCEVILTSSENVSVDDLEAMARELIDTIQQE